MYWGHVSEGRPKVPIIVYSAIAARSIFAILALMTNPVAFVGVYFIYQIVINIGAPAMPALIHKIYPSEFRGRMVGTTRLFLGSMQILATYLAGRYMDRLGYRTIWVAAVAVAIVSALVFSRIREPRLAALPKNHAAFSFKAQLAILGRDRAFLLFLLGASIMGLGNLMSSPAVPLYQVRQLGLSNQQLALVSMVYTGFWLSTYPLWGWVIDRLKPIYAVMGAVALYSLANLSYATSTGISGVFMATILFGIGDSGLDLGWNNQVMRLTKTQVSTYSGLYLTFQGMRGTIGPLLGSVLIPVVGLQRIFFLSTTMTAIGIIPFFFVEKAWARQKQAETNAG